MNNLVDITEVIEEKKKLEEAQKIDRRASFEVLKQCYGYLKMNNLKELHNLKSEMAKVLKTLGNTNER